MTQQKPIDFTQVDDTQIAQLRDIIDELYREKLSVKYTDIMPTADNVSDNELVIYDDGAGTKRLYVITGKKNLGFVALT